MKFSRVKSLHASKQCFKFYGRCVERVKPFLRIFKLCGMLPNEITEGRLKRCSRPLCGVYIFWLSTYASYVCYLSYRFATAKTIHMRLTADYVKHLIGYSSLILNSIMTCSSQDGFGKFYDRLESYDSEVTRMKNRRQDSLWILWIVLLSIILIDLSLMSVIVTAWGMDIIFIITTSDIYTMIMQMYGTLEMFLMLYLMLERFKHLNKKIVPNMSWDERRRESNTIKILDVKTLHSILYDAQRAFNDIYNNLLLIWFSSLMIHVLANVRAFRERGALIACAFILPPILQVLLLCTICHYTAAEANRTSCVLSESMCTLVSSTQTTVKIGVFTYFLQYRISFDAAGFFTIDLPLLQSIAAAVTTYFIILM